MGLFSDLTGFFSTAASGQATRANDANQGNRGRIAHLCRQLGWVLDQRDANAISLAFKDSIAEIRKVYIHGGYDLLVCFTVYSNAIVPREQVPEQVLGHLLRQNSELCLGAWQVDVNDDDETLFSLKYFALANGLSAAVLKHLCETMIREAAMFDDKMQKAGLLRLP